VSTLVTGGSGVVGRALLTHLSRTDTIKALVRSTDGARSVEAAGAQPVFGDILDYRSLIEAMEGCEVVYHVAGLNEMCLADPASLFAVNVDGARNTLRAATTTGIRRMVFTSSSTTLGEVRGSVGNEWSRHRGSFLSNYERSKYEAERTLLAEQGPVEVVVVNPSSVQGPGRATGTGKLFLDMINGRIPAVINSRVSLIDIDDCARGHLLAGGKGRPGERYVLSGVTLSTAEAVRTVEDVTGLTLGLRVLPTGVVRAAAGVVEIVSRLIGKQPPLCREMARVLVFGHAYDGSRAIRDLGLEYTPAHETIRRTIEWFVEQGLVKRKLPNF
jgi:dihydroflavonol-4-reductase